VCCPADRSLGQSPDARVDLPARTQVHRSARVKFRKDKSGKTVKEQVAPDKLNCFPEDGKKNVSD
jgi:hypothetical protein